MQRVHVCVLTSMRVASRFRFSCVIDPLGNALVQGEHQDNSTRHDGRILHNTRTRHPQVECSKHPQVVVFGAVHEPTKLMVSTRILTRENSHQRKTRADATNSMVICSPRHQGHQESTNATHRGQQSEILQVTCEHDHSNKDQVCSHIDAQDTAPRET